MVALCTSSSPKGSLKAWLLASRPWSFTAAVIPLVLGSALACTEVTFRPVLFLLTLLAGVSLQAAVNYLNTYGDYLSGVDTAESVTASCAQLVRGELSPVAMRNAGVLALLLGSAAGLMPVLQGGWPVLVCGLLGIAGAATYTTLLSYKYRGYGPLCVFILMGPLMVLPGYYVQGARGVFLPLLASLPVGCLVAGIMHANDIRDIEHDRAAGICTPSTGLGCKWAIFLFKALYWMAYLILAGLVGLRLLGFFALLPLLVLPVVHQMLSGLGGGSSQERLATLEGSAGKVHFLFGMTLCLGVIISIFLGR